MRNHYRVWATGLSSAISGIVYSFVLLEPAGAQTVATAAPASASALEEVVVTGSHISGTSTLTAPTIVSTFDAKDEVRQNIIAYLATAK
jgi:hypothetical protein